MLNCPNRTSKTIFSHNNKMLPDSFLSLSKRDRAEVVEHFKREFFFNSDSSIIKSIFDDVKLAEEFKLYKIEIRYRARKTNGVKEIFQLCIKAPKEIKE